MTIGLQINKLDGSSAKTSEEMHYAFDHSGRLTAAAFAQSPHTGSGAPTSAPYYTNSWPALARARAYYDYDPGGRLLSVEHYWDTWNSLGNDFDADPILASEYTYDSTKGLKLTADFYKNVSGAWTVEKKQAYAYDADLDYLTQAKYDNDGNGTWDATHNWTYDVAGNRDSDSSNTGTWAYDALNRMTSSPGLAYENDILGNRVWQNRFVSTNGMRMEWDVLNRMTSACKTTGGGRYEYRADGMRIKKIEGLSIAWQETEPETKEQEGSGFYDEITAHNQPTTRYRYDGQMPIEDDYTRFSGHTQLVDVTRNGLGARGIDYIAKTTSSGTTVAFPIYDGHGNMVATLGRNGTGYTLGDQRHYDAWGKIRSGSGTGDPKGRYVANIGHVQDDESGLIYMRARYYESTTGRFVSEDPARESGNWYSYCSNDPVNLCDPNGKNAEVAFWGILSTILMIVAVLLGHGEANLTMAISRAMRDAIQIRSMYGIGMETLANLGKAMERLQDLERRAKNFKRASKAAWGAALLGRILMIKALLIDIDIAGDGPGGLETVFGGD